MDFEINKYNCDQCPRYYKAMIGDEFSERVFFAIYHNKTCESCRRRKNEIYKALNRKT